MPEDLGKEKKWDVKAELRKEKKYILFSLAAGLLNMLVTFGFQAAGIYQSQCLLLYAAVAAITAASTAVFYRSYRRLLGPACSYAAMLTLLVAAGMGVAYMNVGYMFGHGPEAAALMIIFVSPFFFAIYTILLLIPAAAIFSVLRAFKGEKKK